MTGRLFWGTRRARPYLRQLLTAKFIVYIRPEVGALDVPWELVCQPETILRIESKIQEQIMASIMRKKTQINQYNSSALEIDLYDAHIKHRDVQSRHA